MSTLVRLTLLLFLAQAPALAAQVGPSAYAPGTHRYRVTRESKSSQEVMGQVQASAVRTFEEVTLELRAGSRDTMRFVFTLDSASREADIPSAAETVPAKGRPVSGQLSARGVVRQFDTDASPGEDLTAAYRNFLPLLPAGGVKAGMTWTDTLETPFKQSGIEGSTRTIIASRVLGDTTIGGQTAWRIERTGTLGMKGTGMQSGAELVLTGSGSANGVSWVGMNGVYHGARSTQELKLTIEVPAATLTIPISQTTVTRIDRIGGDARTP